MSSVSIHFRSTTDLWATPQEFFDHLDQEFGFELDVCALPGNAKCARFFTPEIDGLKQKWTGVCWMNPPYGRVICEWIRKAYESSCQGATVVCLVPARTDTRWWHDYVMKASDVRFVRDRLKFGGHENSAPFPSAVVVFRPPCMKVAVGDACPATGLSPSSVPIVRRRRGVKRQQRCAAEQWMLL